MGKTYYTQKGTIYNEKHEPVILKGVSKTGLEYGYVDLAAMIPEAIDFDIKKLTEWGVNAVRLPLRDYFWITREEYRNKVAEIVDRLLEKGWVVILDLHTQQQNPAMDKFMIKSGSGDDGKKMWADISVKYKDTPSVFFEIFNEPNHITPDIWWEGDNQYYGYHEILKEIRKSANNICILGGLDYAYQWDFLNYNPRILNQLKSFKNIALATHPYGYRGGPDPTSNGTQTLQIPTNLIQQVDNVNYTGDCHLGITTPTIPYDEYGWNSSFGFLVEKGLFPVIATEWGLDRPDNCIQGGWFNVDMLKYLNSMKISYTAWAWVQDRLDYPSLLDSDFNPTGKGSKETFGPACSGPLNSFYPGPGELVYTDLMSSSSNVNQTLNLSLQHHHNLYSVDSNNYSSSHDYFNQNNNLAFTRNFILFFVCLFFFFNIFYWCPFFLQHLGSNNPKENSNEETTETTSISPARSPPLFHTGIRIRSSHSLGQINRS